MPKSFLIQIAGRMFEELLLAYLVVVDLSIDSPIVLATPWTKFSLPQERRSIPAVIEPPETLEIRSRLGN